MEELSEYRVRRYGWGIDEGGYYIRRWWKGGVDNGGACQISVVVERLHMNRR